MITEDAVPPLPSRAEELDYLNFLEKSIGEDPIITLRPKRYSAGPLRLRWKAMTEIRHEYRKTFLKNFFTSCIIVLPLSI
ncbi:MAG: hypothetical protein ACKO96_38345 [Flammeovirgaceae bacterium]